MTFEDITKSSFLNSYLVLAAGGAGAVGVVGAGAGPAACPRSGARARGPGSRTRRRRSGGCCCRRRPPGVCRAGAAGGRRERKGGVARRRVDKKLSFSFLLNPSLFLLPGTPHVAFLFYTYTYVHIAILDLT